MNCINEKELIDMILEDPKSLQNRELLEHMKACAKCTEALRREVKVWETVHRVWEVWRKENCPDVFLLHEYSTGQLERKQSREVAKHLKECAVCQLKLNEAKEAEKELTIVEAEGKTQEMVSPLRKVFELAKSLVGEYVVLNYPQEERLLEPVFSRIEKILPKLEHLETSKWPLFSSKMTFGTSLGIVSSESKVKGAMIPHVTILVTAILLQLHKQNRIPKVNEVDSIWEKYSSKLGLMDIKPNIFPSLVKSIKQFKNN